ncbi:MAG: ParB/RepB/Spo0J family partition protein [Oscillospiraceae bacterium]|jgi:ParB/RepB/Spo0J family partition protein|nr:ParB/RepB/Spo0J family partition protein [Oscillospiraceae bacterium]
MKTQKMPTLEQALAGSLYGSGTQTPDTQIVELEPAELVEIINQPFRAYDSDKLSQLAESIKESGQQQPCIVRKKDGKYIILAGRNRKRACELAGVKVKCIVRECNDAEADLILTDTNLYQRHELLPSELAYAYKMQKAAYEAKGERKSTAAIADTYGETIKTIQRYIKLADLNHSLLTFVDAGRIPITAGILLTDTKYSDNQQRLAEYLKKFSKQKVSLQQAEDLLKLEEQHDFYSDILYDFFAGKIDLSPAKEKPKPPKWWSPADDEKKTKEALSAKLNSNSKKAEEPIALADTPKVTSYQRLTHERCNGIKADYWSAASKEELVQRLAEFENAYSNGPAK